MQMNGDNVGEPRDEGRLGLRNYMSDAEAKRFHGMFVMSFIAFTVIAIIAHLLVWNWRPWGLSHDARATTTTTSMATAPAAAVQHS